MTTNRKQPLFETLETRELMTAVGNEVSQNTGTNLSTGSIAGIIYTDTNGNGKKDVSEKGAADFELFIDANNDHLFDNNEAIAVTDASGSWKFSDVPSGKSMTVRMLIQPPYYQSSPGENAGIAFKLSAGQEITGKQFGIHFGPIASTGSIFGTIFNDKNGNGKKDSGEIGLAGRTVWIDLDNDKKIDANEKIAITDANGKFKFTGIAAGTYKVRQQLPSGWKQTTPANGFGISVTLASNQSVTGKLFGEKKIS